MNKEQIVAIIQRGYFTDGDLADALLTELAKQSEPVMADGKTRLSDYLESVVSESVIMDDWTKGYEECKRRLYKIVGHQLRQLTPQTDLVAENEQLRQQLSAAQASEGELLTELGKVVAIMEYTGNEVRFPCVYESATKAFAAHKARKDKA